MVKYTQTIRREFTDELFECVWPFCEIVTHIGVVRKKAKKKVFFDLNINKMGFYKNSYINR